MRQKGKSMLTVREEWLNELEKAAKVKAPDVNDLVNLLRSNPNGMNIDAIMDGLQWWFRKDIIELISDAREMKLVCGRGVIKFDEKTEAKKKAVAENRRKKALLRAASKGINNVEIR